MKTFRSNFAFWFCTIVVSAGQSAVAYPQEQSSSSSAWPSPGRVLRRRPGQGSRRLRGQLGEDSDIYNITSMTAGTAPKGLGNVVFAGKDFQQTTHRVEVPGRHGHELRYFRLGDLGLQQNRRSFVL